MLKVLNWLALGFFVLAFAGAQGNAVTLILSAVMVVLLGMNIKKLSDKEK